MARVSDERRVLLVRSAAGLLLGGTGFAVFLLGVLAPWFPFPAQAARAFGFTLFIVAICIYDGLKCALEARRMKRWIQSGADGPGLASG